MFGYVLQDWVTIRGNTSITSVPQGENAWLGLAPYQDIVLWLDVRALTTSGLSSLIMNYETAPAKDENLFTSMTTGVSMAAAATPTVTKILLSQNPAVPLGRWVRWRLSTYGAATGVWDATFRILACCNAAAGVSGGG
jgi:hypothetical protein